MARFDYNKEHFETVSVCGIKCLFNDARIDRKTVPEGKHQYEIGGTMIVEEIRREFNMVFGLISSER